MTIQNCTPHTITLLVEGKDAIVLPSSGVVPRLAVTRLAAGEIDGIPAVRPTMGATTGLPDQEEGVTLLVSALVAEANRDRRDLVSPGELVRGPDGQPVGCRGLSVYWGSL
jgi:hypothetical protein